MSVLIIGIGNEARRDDGVGIAVASSIAECRVPGVEVLISAGDPEALIDAWTGVRLVIAVDASVDRHVSVGAIRRWEPADLHGRIAEVSSHGLGLPETHRLGQALGRAPGRFIVFTVEAGDVGHGFGMTPAVAHAVPDVVTAILGEISARDGSGSGVPGSE
ncbi:hydrogenase maturation protease [Mycolicibacterium goodii]|uniref:hydrogenase maturation protease n=1 Tax=Mycolicibacterium goodii TaxID=134601 RepID=UPI001BDBB95F|nr:hydrogenase maturation protease [Mycolicibacterium goodii]MBU8811337.1 hydrogenase maturation protease [Mycolicibacterium goodii]MBU8831851.1 hydrogenase maturation protease [Mycolicibacterium goodii]ULN45400.1 hydrogenase maturation protease [Mycolicibacterium goodii]